MQLDLTATIIFASFSLLLFRHELTQKTTIILGVVVGILPLVAKKGLAFIPTALNDKADFTIFTVTASVVTLLVLQLVCTIVIFLLIQKDNDSLYRFIGWFALGLFVVCMLLPTVIS